MSDTLDATARWIEQMVIGEGLCPFARGPWRAGQVRLALSQATNEQALVEQLAEEVQSLLAHKGDEAATTVLVHPHVLANFEDYNTFLNIADEVVLRLGAEGVLQIASFHPDYRFADAPPDDAANYTNRSPFPMLHLLREADVARAVDSGADVDSVPERNVRHLRSLGREALEVRLKAIVNGS